MMNGSDSSGRERKNDMKNVIKEVAKKNGVSEEEVREIFMYIKNIIDNE